MKSIVSRSWPLFIALVLYALLADHLSFTQDDAYITYRYVANFLNGDGLVYNIGEQVEGITNFGWAAYLIALGSLGLNYILASKITGFIFGAGIILLTGLLTRVVLPKSNLFVQWLPVFLVACNQSLAYWAPAGLETAAFAFFSMLSLYLFLHRSRWLIATLLVCVLLRPEGALVSGLLILIELVVERRIPRFTLTCVAAAFVLSLPYVGFKLYYYGSILPNPFYAKTGLHADVFVSGLEYAGRFFAHYGFFGVGFLGSALLWSRLARSGRTVLLYAAAYTVYIIIVGGDVLKVHRFFLPLFGPAAILVALVAQHVTSRMRVRTQSLIITAVGVCLLSLTYFLPRGFVEQYNYLERSFVIKMRTMATNIRASDSSNFSVALPTIGVFGFELMGHRIIDLVGLTDSTIARHSEEPIPGMKTTWKEQKHNSAYVLSQEPDYIQFSTGIKPSAPAERALVLYPQFQQSYRSIGWYFSIDPNRQGVIHSVFKKVRPLIGELKPTYPVDFVENYKLGLDAAVAGDFATAVQFYGRALKASPKPYYVNLLANRAYCHMMLQQHDKAQALLEYILSTDSLVYEAHQYQYFYSNMAGDSASAAYHLSWLEKLVPWYVPRIKMLAARQTQSSQRPRR